MIMINNKTQLNLHEVYNMKLEQTMHVVRLFCRNFIFGVVLACDEDL